MALGDCKHTAAELADILDKADHLLIDHPPTTDDGDWVAETISADDHELIVEALRAYAEITA